MVEVAAEATSLLVPVIVEVKLKLGAAKGHMWIAAGHPTGRWSRLDSLAASSAAVVIIDAGLPITPPPRPIGASDAARSNSWQGNAWRRSPAGFPSTPHSRRGAPTDRAGRSHTLNSLLSVAAAHQACKVVQPVRRLRVRGFSTVVAAQPAVVVPVLTGLWRTTPTLPCLAAPALQPHQLSCDVAPAALQLSCAQAQAAAEYAWVQAAIANRMACVLATMDPEDARCLDEARRFLAGF